MSSNSPNSSVSIIHRLRPAQFTQNHQHQVPLYPSGVSYSAVISNRQYSVYKVTKTGCRVRQFNNLVDEGLFCESLCLSLLVEEFLGQGRLRK